MQRVKPQHVRTQSLPHVSLQVCFHVSRTAAVIQTSPNDGSCSAALGISKIQERNPTKTKPCIDGDLLRLHPGPDRPGPTGPLPARGPPARAPSQRAPLSTLNALAVRRKAGVRGVHAKCPRGEVGRTTQPKTPWSRWECPRPPERWRRPLEGRTEACSQPSSHTHMRERAGCRCEGLCLAVAWLRRPHKLIPSHHGCVHPSVSVPWPPAPAVTRDPQLWRRLTLAEAAADRRRAPVLL